MHTNANERVSKKDSLRALMNQYQENDTTDCLCRKCCFSENLIFFILKAILTSFASLLASDTFGALAVASELSRVARKPVFGGSNQI